MKTIKYLILFVLFYSCSITKPYNQKDFIRIGRKYGFTFNVVGGPSNYDGILVVVPKSSPVFASFSGTVINTGYKGKRGNSISIKSDNEIKTTYYHLDKFLVNVGDSIKKGQQIAISGSSGACTGPCLGIAIYQNDSVINPNTFLKLYK